VTNICIVGAGELGGAVAHALARADRASRITLIDEAGSVAAGKALDIQQSGAIEGFRAVLDGTDDWTRVTACSVCIVADRAAKPAGEWQGEEALTMLRRLLPYSGAAPVVFAGATQSGLVAAVVREAGARRQAVIGSASEAFAAAARAIVAVEAKCSPAEVALAVLGAPPAGLVIPWSEAAIGGYTLERLLNTVQIARIEARVARLWPPGPFALGLASARVADALVCAGRRTFHVLSVLGGEFGARGRVGVLPALLGPTGIVHTRLPTLSTRERVRVETVLGG
jgi:malate dehydrogenase